MLKWYADMFRFNSKTISHAGLRRVRVMYVLSLPFVPLVLLVGAYESGLATLPDSGAAGLATWTALMALLFVSMIAVVAMCLTKFVNRFWARDRYLDEWELGHKHASMAFGFQFAFYAAAVMFLASFALTEWIGWTGPTLTLTNALTLTLGVMLVGFYAQIWYLLQNIRPVDVADGAGPSAVYA